MFVYVFLRLHCSPTKVVRLCQEVGRHQCLFEEHFGEIVIILDFFFAFEVPPEVEILVPKRNRFAPAIPLFQ